MEEAIYDLLVPTASFAAAGVSVGAVLAAARSRPIAGSAVGTGLNFGLLGGTFTCLRQAGHFAARSAYPVGGDADTDPETRRALERQRSIGVSAASGALTGTFFNSLVRGSRGLATAVLFYGSLGALGEFSYGTLRTLADPTRPRREPAMPAERTAEGDKSVWQKLKDSSPMRPIPNDEFEALMQGKIAHLDDQIALVEEELRHSRSLIRKDKSAT